MTRTPEKIGVAGLGKIGLPLALVLANHGFSVTGIDISEKALSRIRRREKFVEPRVNEYIERAGRRFRVSSDHSLLKETPIVFVIVNTPGMADGFFDISDVERCVREIHKTNPDSIAVIDSTLNPGDTEKLRKIHPKICYNPDWIALGSAIHDFENPRFTLIGAYDHRVRDAVANVWRKVHNRPIITGSPIEMEMAKLVLNISHAVGITYANIIGELCEAFGVNPDVITDMIEKNLRGYRSGLGFGGPCLPRDVPLLEAVSSKKGADGGRALSRFLQEMNIHTVKRYCDAITRVAKKNVGIVGVTYKPGVALLDHSQAVKVLDNLSKDRRYHLHVYDPIAEIRQQVASRYNVTPHSSLKECVAASDTLFIGAPVSEVKSLDGSLLRDKNVIDPWRCLASRTRSKRILVAR